MTIAALQQTLSDRAQSFLALAMPLSDEQFFAPLDGDKWSVAENLQHLYLSTRPVARLLVAPREFLTQFGKPTQPSRPYEQVVADYRRTVTDNGIKAPATMSARAEDLTSREVVAVNFAKAHHEVIKGLNNWTEDELESYQAPHPALGMLTIRELIYFTAYHINHHLEPTRERI
jgi:hypothetical protein